MSHPVTGPSTAVNADADDFFKTLRSPDGELLTGGDELCRGFARLG